jgi:hypothetical protein
MQAGQETGESVMDVLPNSVLIISAVRPCAKAYTLREMHWMLLSHLP